MFGTRTKQPLLTFGVLGRPLRGSRLESIDFPHRISGGAPAPELVAREHEAYLSFYLEFISPTWDGTVEPFTEEMRNEQDHAPCCVFTFENLRWSNLGHEGEDSWPWDFPGFDCLKPQVLLDSSLQWRGSGVNHYIFWFHDTTFQCTARSFSYMIYSPNVSSAHEAT